MKLRLTRDVTPQECHWLERTFRKGETLYRYSGYPYGCMTSGVAVTEKLDETPFFEIPSDAVTPENA